MRRVVLAAIFLTPTIVAVVSLFALLTIPNVETTVCSQSSSNSGWICGLILGEDGLPPRAAGL
jgi:hypothetical protein